MNTSQLRIQLSVMQSTAVNSMHISVFNVFNQMEWQASLIHISDTHLMVLFQDNLDKLAPER